MEPWDSSCLVLGSQFSTRFRMTHFFQIDDLSRQRAERNKLYFEFLRVPAMSAGVYVLPKNHTDPQKPHREDEMYYVVRGRGRMQIGSDHSEVRAGSVIFVEAELEHRFYDIEEELEVLVFFAPAETE
jgi:mannose-6-phosphate isomerase-like protein (cupin superfamily)